MILELLTIGDELIDGRRIDTNTAWIGRKLTSLGFPPRYHQSPTDRMEDIVAAFREALLRSDIVISTGGLGPTSDDITFEALATALGRPLEYRPEIFEKIKRRFEERNLRCPESNRRQAMLPSGSTELPNDLGTAPGCRMDIDGRTVFVFPGVPAEMEPLFLAHVVPALKEHTSPTHQRTELTFKFAGLAESVVEERIQACRLDEIHGAEIRIAYTATFPQIDVTLSVLPNPHDRLSEILRMAGDRISTEFGEHLIACGEETLESRVVSELTRLGLTVAVAESVTGGLVTAQLVSVPGSSRVLDCGVVAYSNVSKVEVLGVSEETLKRHGAVSDACALEMARGIRARARTSIGVATTGIAGPDGGSAEKPLGLVYLAWVGPGVEEVRKFQFRWDRNRNRILAATEALRGLLRLVVSPNFRKEKE